MDNHISSPLVNRDDPIPVLQIPLSEDTKSASPAAKNTPKTGRREAFKKEAEKLKSKLEDVGDQYRASGGSLQDRMYAMLMQQIMPPEIAEDGTEVKDRRSRQYVDRPSFSVGAMSSNFRRFNARIGIVFVFQNRLIRLFTWREPTHTLSFLALYTLVVLQPSLLPVVPLALCMFFIMIPSFLARHPPPPTASEDNPRLSDYSGPPVAPPTRVKPAPEMSKDFFRNMRDLQNSMEDFSRAHDSAVQYIQPYTDFSDEAVSSTVFLALAGLLCVALVASHVVPWRTIVLVAGWTAVAAGHPDVQEFLLNKSNASTMKQKRDVFAKRLRDWINADIVMDEPPEVREVEIFELQKLQRPSFGIDTDIDGFIGGEWEPWLFTSTPYDPMSPSRIAGARLQGTQFFEEVQPPNGWTWRDKKWSLDLGSREWVEERCVTGVEVETEGERWVYDIADESKASKKGARKTSIPKSWEEGTGRAPKGEWRRRRWVRLVERKVVKVSPND